MKAATTISDPPVVRDHYTTQQELGQVARPVSIGTVALG